jgi:hypothetical protein
MRLLGCSDTNLGPPGRRRQGGGKAAARLIQRNAAMSGDADALVAAVIDCELGGAQCRRKT